MRALVLLLLSLTGCSDDLLQSRPDPYANPDPASHDSCVEADTPCAVSFRYPLSGASSVELRGDFAPDGWDVGVPMQIDGAEFRTEIALPQGARIQYKFVLNGSEWVNDPQNPETQADGVGGVNSVVTASCGYTICPQQMPPPPVGTFDWRSAVMYFVFVDRFNDGDTGNNVSVPGVQQPANYQGGDWAGVIAKIEDGYFDSLGVNALWLTVPMDNTPNAGVGFDGNMYSAYHGYWPSDLDEPEERFGTLDTLKALVDAAHARGIKVLLDYAMNHVHSDNPIVAQNPSWFWPLDYNGQTCVCGVGCDWNDDYENKRCWFTDYLPDWNFQNAAARAFSVDNAISWVTKTGVDGFRLDAVKHIELDWLLDLRARVASEIEPNSGEHFYMVGETFESANRDLIKYYVGADRLDGQFDFPLRAVLVETLLRRTGTLYDLDAFLATNDSYYPGVMSTFIGNHDIARVIHSALDQPWGAWDNGDPWNAPPPLPDYAAPFERMAVAFGLLFTTKGIPLVYYGDEIGMAGAGDPDNRRFMQWEGLSQHQLKLRTHLEKLGAIRKDHPALWRGTRNTLSVSPDTYAYRMADAESGDEVFVALNRGDQNASVDGMPAKGRDEISGAQLTGPQLSVPPRTIYVVTPE